MIKHRRTPKCTERELLYEDLTGRIREVAIEVHKYLGPGFLEKGYFMKNSIISQCASVVFGVFRCLDRVMIKYRRTETRNDD